MQDCLGIGDFRSIFGTSLDNELTVYDNQGPGWRKVGQSLGTEQAWGAYWQALGGCVLIEGRKARLYVFSPDHHDYYVVFGDRRSLPEWVRSNAGDAAEFGEYVDSLLPTDAGKSLLLDDYARLTIR